jgi:hypothetical protein
MNNIGSHKYFSFFKNLSYAQKKGCKFKQPFKEKGCESPAALVGFVDGLCHRRSPQNHRHGSCRSSGCRLAGHVKPVDDLLATKRRHASHPFIHLKIDKFNMPLWHALKNNSRVFLSYAHFWLKRIGIGFSMKMGYG